MSGSQKKNRIIFIDLLRAFAVIQMVQGHTTDVLLADSVRDFNNPIFYFWHFMRGMTAPIFLFTAGTVFTYLFRLNSVPFKENNRVPKGLKRVGLLLFIGYMLRYPTPSLFDFSAVTHASWVIFFTVDVLHLIGVTLFIVIILAWLAESSKLKDSFVFGTVAFLFFALYPLVHQVRWVDFLHPFLAGYLYTGSGSQFPLFPWAGYLLSGAVLGSFLANNPAVFKSIKFSRNLAIAGAIFMAVSYFGDKVEFLFLKGINWYDTYSIVFQRMGFVLILVAAVSFVSIKVDYIPKLIILLGRNTLLIYVIHLVILYGSAWNPGLNKFFERALGGWPTFAAALLMVLLMMGVVLLGNKLKLKNKELVT